MRPFVPLVSCSCLYAGILLAGGEWAAAAAAVAVAVAMVAAAVAAVAAVVVTAVYDALLSNLNFEPSGALQCGAEWSLFSSCISCS